ncbi:hypothetical protein BACPU_21880 [Bacillus pumilus]|nr:hypothetical protein BACPU_21880 [Bacillus pumilus]
MGTDWGRSLSVFIRKANHRILLYQHILERLTLVSVDVVQIDRREVAGSS